jgi:hypothetical protein
VTGGGGFTRIDVADNNDVNVNLFLTHFDRFFFVLEGSVRVLERTVEKRTLWRSR